MAIDAHGALRWLAHAKAQRLFGYAFAALLGVCAWWGWQERFSPSQLGLNGIAGGPANPARFVDGSLLAPEDAATSRVRGDPFLLRFSRSRRWRPRPTRYRTNQPSANPQPRWRPPQPQPTPQPIPRAPKRTVTLVYHGTWTLLDGKPAARIENSETKTTAFYASGSKLEWLTVSRVDMTGIEIRSSDGSLHKLKRGQSATFEEGSNGR